MITEVDDALCRLLGRRMPEGTVVRLDPPKPTWQTERPSNTIDLFLFGLHDDSNVPAQRDSVRRCELSYLVTARAEKIHEEHRLLDRALRTAMFAGTLPADCMSDSLAATTNEPIFLRIASTGPGALWTSLGMPARAAFVMNVSVPMVPEQPPVRTQPRRVWETP
ncbi:Pvc16 family protein [Actinocrispum sp. NPDC049592]|uniref:Pvc16 family protein n=1 Tax=Actinocrispum sp. NPDC049592 TaxID=3154835 RepID=UPI0034217413